MRKAAQPFGGAFPKRAVACQSGRAVCLFDRIDGGAGGFVICGGAAGDIRRHHRLGDVFLGDVFRQFDDGHAGFLGLRDLECLPYDSRKGPTAPYGLSLF